MNARLQSLFSLAGQIALVTGSSAGIGFALARALGAAGATVLVNGRNPDTVDKAVGALKSEGVDAVSAPRST